MAKKSRLSELKTHLKEKNPQKLYLMYGEEAYGKKLYINRLCELVDDSGFSDFNKIVLDAKDASFTEIDDSIESFPMMTDKKLVIIRDSGIFKKSNEEQREYWTKRINDIPEYVVLIFDEHEVDKRSALYKKAAKLGVDVEFEYMNETELVTWVEREVLKERKKIAKDVAQYFVSICDEGMANIKNELDKLINYCDDVITKTDVEKIVSKAVGVKVFELTDCMMSKNANGALSILKDLKTAKEPAFKILYLLSSTFEKMLRCSLMLSEGQSYAEIASKIGVAPFIAQKYANSARGFGENYLADRVIEVAQIDLAIKNGETGDWDALEKYVLDSCEKVG